MEEVKSGRWCAPQTDAREIPAAIHAEQFVPLLVARFGDDWWRRGALSLCVASTTVSGERVQCHLEAVPGDRCRVWMNAGGETLILSGCATVEDNPLSPLLEVLAGETSAQESRVLSGVRAGETSPLLRLCISAAAVDARLPGITEPLAAYRDPSAFGGRVVPPASLAENVRVVERAFGSPEDAVEQLERGLEIRYLNGPVLCDRDYLVRGEVLGIAGTARDETVWYQADVHHAHDQVAVARVIRMQRFAPAGLPLAHSAP